MSPWGEATPPNVNESLRLALLRAEKAELEAARLLKMVSDYQQVVLRFPMTTVDEDGKVWQVERHGTWDRVVVYRLAPIEDPKGDPALDAELAEFQSGTTVAKRIAQAREETP